MASWLSKLLGPSKQGAPAGPSAPQTTSAGASTRPATGASLPPADAAPMPAALSGSRRPLFQREGQLAGFEFMVAGAYAQRLARRTDPVAYAAHAAALMGSVRATLATRRVALLSLPLNVATRPSVLTQLPAGALLALTEVDPRREEDVAALLLLRPSGVRLGAVDQAIPGGSFVLLDGAQLGDDTLAESVAHWRHTQPEQRLIVTGLADIESLEAALQLGVDWASGVVDRRRSPRPAPGLSVRAQRLCVLINHIVRDDDLSSLANELRTEVEMSYQLLAHANSPLLALTRRADSVEQAVMLLGRDGLYRWLTLQLLSAGDARPTSRALQEVSLARAHLLEALAPAAGAPPGLWFTVGLLSLLEVLLKQPMVDVLAPLQLPEPAVLALVERSGPWAYALDLVQALEQGAMDQAEEHAQALGGLDQVTPLADAAWAWAAQAVRGS